jgi:hypothetical protein
LDILNYLSGYSSSQCLLASEAFIHRNRRPLPLDLEVNDPNRMSCFFGFAPRCASILEELSTHMSEYNRSSIICRFQSSLNYSYVNGNHVCDLEVGLNLRGINTAFHKTGELISMTRCRPRSALLDPGLIYHVVSEILTAVESIPEKGNQNACLLFPLFTTGYYTQPDNTRDEIQRCKIVQRLTICKSLGMPRVCRCILS